MLITNILILKFSFNVDDYAFTMYVNSMLSIRVYYQYGNANYYKIHSYWRIDAAYLRTYVLFNSSIFLHRQSDIFQFLSVRGPLFSPPPQRSPHLLKIRLSAMQSIIICMHFRGTLSVVFSCLFLCVGLCAPCALTSVICSCRSLSSSPCIFQRKDYFSSSKSFIIYPNMRKCVPTTWGETCFDPLRSDMSGR